MILNGNLVLNADATGELQNVYIERLSAAPTFNPSEMGRVYFNTTTALFYFNDGSAWQPFATGGNATLLQQYLNNLIASVGPAVTGSGTWNGSTAFAGDPILSGATSLTNALTLLSTAAFGHEMLSELGDVALGSLSNGQFLTYSSGSAKWTNHTLVTSDITDLTVAAADLNLLKGASAGTGLYNGAAITSVDLSYLSGATSNIQAQLNNLQPLNANLTDLATLNSTGFLTQIGSNAFAERTFVAPTRGFTINNPDGVSGNPTFVLANNLAAIEGLTSEPGFLVFTADGVATLRSLITGTTGTIVVSNGNGQSASPTVDLQTVTATAGGTFQKFATDTYGRVNAVTPVVQNDITNLVDSVYLHKTGDTMTGSLTMTNGATVTGVPTPTNATDVANKSYVDGVASSLNIHTEVDAATTGPLPGTVTYANGTNGVGANLTIVPPITVIDGVSLVAGVEGSSSRVLVKNQATQTQNGVYYVSGNTGSQTTLTRASDSDNHIADQVHAGDFVFVVEGSTYASTGWVMTTVGSGSNEATVIGTDNITWSQFSGAGTYTAGTGLILNGGQFSVNYGAGIASIPTGEVGINLWAANSSALILTTDGSSRSPVLGAALALLLPAGSGLVQDGTGLYIGAGGVTNAMLQNSAIIVDVDSNGTNSIALGGTLSIFGSSAQGISTSTSTVGGQPVVTVTASDASNTQKGVAKYNAATFSVTAGQVSIIPGGVSNTQLANSTLTVTGTNGSSTIALGGSIALVGDGSTGITTQSSSGTITFSNNLATTSAVGVAKFNPSSFSVDGTGNVTLNPISFEQLSDVSVNAIAPGQIPVWSSSNSHWQNESVYYLYSATSPALTHTVVHNLGQKYCSVTVVDSTDEVVIPQSITFNDSNTLTVTFTSSITCKVVAMGLALS